MRSRSLAGCTVQFTRARQYEPERVKFGRRPGYVFLDVKPRRRGFRYYLSVGVPFRKWVAL